MTKFLTEASKTRSYFDGSVFSENAEFTYKIQVPLKERVQFICDLAKSKRVLHIGCCDHHDVVKEKLASNNWLHSKLTDSSAHCVGIDIDPKAIELARSISGLNNIFLGDITATPKIPELDDQDFDYAVFADVVEHIGNPVHFLSTFLILYGSRIKEVVITVPNSLWVRNIMSAIKTKEVINTDHRICFTPYAISKVAWDSGLEPVSIDIVNYTSPSALKQRILTKFPLLGGGIAYVGRPKRQA
jgi:hypothetical protein